MIQGVPNEAIPAREPIEPCILAWSGNHGDTRTAREAPVTNPKTIKTWRERCDELHSPMAVVSSSMIQQRMQEEIDELRAALKSAHEPTGEQPCSACGVPPGGPVFHRVDPDPIKNTVKLLTDFNAGTGPKPTWMDLFQGFVAAHDSMVELSENRQTEPEAIRCPDCGKTPDADVTVRWQHECMPQNRPAEPEAPHGIGGTDCVYGNPDCNCGKPVCVPESEWEHAGDCPAFHVNRSEKP